MQSNNALKNWLWGLTIANALLFAGFIALFNRAIHLTDSNSSSQLPAPMATQERVAALESELSSLKQTVDWNYEIFSVLGNEHGELLKSKFPTSVYFSPTDTEYFPIHTSSGVIMLKINDIKPFANGSKVTFEFASAQSVAFTGLKGTVTWKTKNMKPVETKSKEFSIVNDVLPATWSKQTLVLEDATPDSLVRIEVRDLEPGGAKLFK